MNDDNSTENTTSRSAMASNRGKAEHGASSEVTWNGGAGRQPYANQGAEEAGVTGGGNEFAEGDRGELSGRNREQLDEVRKRP